MAVADTVGADAMRGISLALICTHGLKGGYTQTGQR